MDSGRVDSGDEGGFTFGDFAVLYRTETQADDLVEALARSSMPFQCRAHGRLTDLPSVQAVMASMRSDRSAKSALEQLDDALATLDAPLAEEARPFAETLRSIAEQSSGVDGFLSQLAMGADADLWDPRADAVSLLTLHAAKGLEFSVVFMVGCEDGLLPLHWGNPADVDMDEERRLFFVGMTRARRRLFLCHAAKRSRMGKVRPMSISPFVADIKEELLERSKSNIRGRRKASHKQLDLF
jgi:superfamily I DNA/RNA helicase